MVNFTLALLFGLLFLTAPTDVLRIELEIIAIFNLFLALFATFVRLTPNHDNILFAWFATTRDEGIAKRNLSLINLIFLAIYVIGGIFLLVISWIAFGWWFLIAIMFSQLTTVAESFGEYTENMPLAEEKSTKTNAETIQDLPGL